MVHVYHIHVLSGGLSVKRTSIYLIACTRLHHIYGYIRRLLLEGLKIAVLERIRYTRNGA